jgi:tubulin--tyrosine ligase
MQLRGVLLTNDDGPPHPSKSPFIEAFIRELLRDLEACTNVFICTPAQQQSFVGHALTRNPAIHTHIVNPKRWNIEASKGNKVVLATVEGTPATAVNIALEHILPFPIDLVISGPNFGQNAGSSFIGCSGTVGAALEASIQGFKSIALSFAYSSLEFTAEDIEIACRLAIKVIREIWAKWKDQEKVELFNINVPIGAKMDAKIYTTFVHHEKSYGKLYKRNGGRDISNDNYLPNGEENITLEFGHGELKFDKNAPVGSDRWAINNKFVSVTPLVGCLQIAPLSDSPFEQVQL